MDGSEVVREAPMGGYCSGGGESWTRALAVGVGHTVVRWGEWNLI